MNRQQAIKGWEIKRTFIALVVVFVATVACQNNNQGLDNRVTSSQSNSKAEVKQAINQGGQNNNTEVTSQNTSKAENNEAENNEATKPSIQITDVPSRGAGPDAMERIAGTVSGVNVKECKVVIFAHTDSWYVQPYIASPDTPIEDDGMWENDTHLGSEYAALLVKASYKPPATTGTLPKVAGLVLAVARVAAKK